MDKEGLLNTTSSLPRWVRFLGSSGFLGAALLFVGATVPVTALGESPSQSISAPSTTPPPREDEKVFSSKEAYLRELCAENPSHPDCPKRGKRNRPPRDLRELCRLDRFHPRCQAARNKVLEESYAIEQFCNSTKKKDRCISRRKSLKRRMKELE